VCGVLYSMVSLFFFQAEDGIRDFHVTGVQTCALPISLTGTVGLASNVVRTYSRFPADVPLPIGDVARTGEPVFLGSPEEWNARRSEERRVGKEGKLRRATDPQRAGPQMANITQ